jgi:hypothetical protein
MFRKILIVLLFATAAGYCFASDNGLKQVVTSEVFYDKDRYVNETIDYSQYEMQAVPVWPMVGSDADTEVSCKGVDCAKSTDNLRIVSKIGADLTVENNFNIAPRGQFGNWSGGANMLHGSQVPMGFDDECNTYSEMPLMHREMLEDDGGEILAVSRAARKKCSNNIKRFVAEEETIALSKDGRMISVEIAESADAESDANVPDQVRSWVVANGQTLREVLQNWCDKEGWDLVWATPREYPIEASAVFKGRFVDVASALVRNFGRANPVPNAKFYKGNRVLVVSTTEE